MTVADSLPSQIGAHPAYPTIELYWGWLITYGKSMQELPGLSGVAIASSLLPPAIPCLLPRLIVAKHLQEEAGLFITNNQ